MFWPLICGLFYPKQKLFADGMRCSDYIFIERECNNLPFKKRECAKLFLMRIDKFLKVSRLIKRRELAKRLCEAGDILINGKPAKPSSEVEEGQRLSLTIGRHRIEAEVKMVRPYASKEQAEAMFAILSDEIIKEEELHA